MTLDQLSAAATQTEDDIRYYSGGSKYNEPLEQLKDRLVELYRTGQLVAVADDAVDRVARAIGTSLAYDIGMDVRAGSLTDDEKRKVATKAIAAMKDTQP